MESDNDPRISFQLDWHGALVAGLFIMAGVGLIAGGMYAFAATVTPAQMVFWFLSLVASGAIGWKLHGIKPPREIITQAAPETQDTVDGDWRPAPLALPAKRSIPAADLGAMLTSETIWDLDDEGKRIEISRPALEHFIDVCWPTPKRDDRWKMAAEDYGAAAAFLCACQGHPLQKKGRTFVWHERIQRDHLLHWYDLTLRQAQLRGPERTNERTND